MRSVPQVSLAQYASYAAWVGIKRQFHLSCSGHRRFFLLQFMRALNTRRIGARCHITTAGKKDGAGAQALAKMSALCLAHAYGLPYVHTPFANMAHAECAPDQWAQAWEERFRFGAGELQSEQVELPRWSLETFVTNQSLWREPCVVVAPHYHTFCDLQPDAYLGIIPRLQEKYQVKAEDTRGSQIAKVCVHVRRGDVARGDADTVHRYTPNHAILNTVRQLQQVLAEQHRPYRICVYSQGDSGAFRCFAELGCELCLNGPALETFHQLVVADILVMARSTFSYTAALLGRGVKLYDPQDHAPLPEWIVTNPRSGRFDVGRLAAALKPKTVSCALFDFRGGSALQPAVLGR